MPGITAPRRHALLSFARRGWFALAVLCASSCGGGGDGPPAAPPPPAEALTAVTLAPSNPTLVVGASTTLTPTPTTGGSGVSVSYGFATSAPGVATVNAAGTVTAVSVGTATITVSATGSGSGFATSTRQAVAVLTVSAPPAALTSMSVTPDSVALVTGGSATLTASASTAGASVSVTYGYTSNATTIATVNDAGMISAVSPGTATIAVTATGTGSGFDATTLQTNVAVLVSAPPLALSALSVAPDRVALMAGDTARLTASATTTGAHVSVAYVYTSSAPTVASVDSHGVVTAVSVGTATVTVRATGSGVGVTTATREATAEVTVSAPALPEWRREEGHPGEGWAARWGDWTVAAGRLWVVENERSSTSAPRVHHTADGGTWQTIDARAIGLPDLPVGTDFWGGNTTLVTGTDDEVVIATTLITPSMAPGSGIEHTFPWIVRGTPGNWTVQGPANSPGLDPRQIPNAAGLRFGMSTMTGATAAWGDRVVLLPRGIWWTPGSTTDQSFVSLTSSASAAWQLFAQRGYPWGVNSFQWMTGAAGTPWGFFAVGHIAFTTEVWYSADGYDWNVITDPVRAFGGSRTGSSVVWSGAMMYGAHGLVMARVRDTPSAQMVAWHTRDGQQWQESVIADEAYGDVQGFTTGSHYVVAVPQTTSSSDRQLRHVWVSRNAQQWVRIPEGPRFTKIIGWGDRLWGFRSGEVWVLDLSTIAAD